jgi:hypothetical protein
MPRVTYVPPFAVPPRVPAVEPDLLSSAIFLFGEYLAQLAAETPPPDDNDDDDDDDEAEDGTEIDTAEVLDLFAEELGTNVQTTLTLYMRVTALYRLLAASPSLAQRAMDQEDAAGNLTDEALVAASRLDLYVTRNGDDGAADFDPREFREALSTA